MRARMVVLSALAGALLAALPAAGDWLVTRDGTRIEIAGTWQVKGSQVIFTLPGGRLSALRAADVDLEASAEETRRAASAADEAAADETAVAGETATNEAAPRGRAKRPVRPVRTFTNDNVGWASGVDQAEETDPDAAEEEAEVAEPDPEEAEPAEPVELVSWHSLEDGDGLQIRGTLRNTGAGIAADIRLTLTVPGDEDEPTFETRAFLDASALAPGASTGFRALLPGIFALPEDPSFTIRSEGFTIGAPARPAADESEGFDENEGAAEPEGTPIG